MSGDLEVRDKDRRPGRRGIWRMLWTVLIIYAVWLALGCAIQRSMLYPRHFTAPPADPGADIPGVEMNQLETAAGDVDLWFIAGDGVSEDSPGPAVMFAHGNAELIDHQAAIVDGFRRMGVSVMLCEYRGYGRSEGSPTQNGIVEDYVRAYDRLSHRAGVDAKRIIFYGRSLGGGVVCALAEHRKPKAIIFQSPFTSVTSFAARMLIPPLFVLDKYDNAAFLKTADLPVLIMHGKYDSIIPITHGRKLDAIAPRSTFIEYDSDHNDFPVESEKHWSDVRNFLTENDVLH